MFSLIVGGAASGKSAYAEALALGLAGRRTYVATMMPWDEECKARIARHRARRAGHGFATLECYRDLAALEVPRDANVLLDCVGNLLSNEMYGLGVGPTTTRPQAADAVIAGVRRLNAQCRNLTVVTNEVCLAGTDYEGDTLPYLQALGRINRTLAVDADFACEVVAGLPNVLKGVRPCTC